MSKINPTQGEKRVGWDFVPSGNDVADGVKTQCASLIDLLSNYKHLDPEHCDKAQALFEEGCENAMKVLVSLKRTKIGIVMPAINLWAKYTKPAIDSVIEAIRIATLDSKVECCFVFIDNGSTDETQEEAPNIKEQFGAFGHRFEYQRNEDMWGFQKSVNFGVNRVFEKGYQIALVLNNDILLHPKALIRIAERFEQGGVGMVTCMDATAECGADPSNIYGIDDEEKSRNCPESEHPHFSAFAVSRDCWERVGEFDEVFFPAYYEDNDYHYRMRLVGIKAVMYPPALFFHYGSRTQNEALGRPISDSHNQHMFYIAKWGGSPGQEKWSIPYDDPHKTILKCKQHEIGL